MTDLFRIVMLGGRRCGKSSVLASMIKCYNKQVKTDKLTLRPIGGTENRLREKLNDLEKELFSHGADRFTVDETPTNDINRFDFELSVKDVYDRMHLEFLDIPGERFNASFGDSMNDEINSLISGSNILIIAIDSVQLMEEGGCFSDVYNNTKMITEWVRSSDFAASEPEKLVLFVPLKCETYYHSGRMKQLCDRVKEEYSNLLGFFSCSNLRDKVTVAITPILTVGNVVFDSFGRDAGGKIILNRIRGGEYLRPLYTYYKYTKPNASFDPRYCEQPFLYVMSFVLKFYDKHDKRVRLGIIGRLVLNIVLLFFPALRIFANRIFYKSVSDAAVHVKKDGDGYEIVQNPMNI